MSAAEERPLLLHSLGEFREIILDCLEAAGARRVLEIGGEGAGLTRVLAEWASDRDAEIVCVESQPSTPLRELAASGRLTLVEGKSPDALAGLDPCDAYVIDGDHNHWVVSAELAAIHAATERPLVFMHDVAWPAARRDQYYDPADVPEEHQQPHSYDLRAMPGEASLGREGFFGGGSFAYALEEGGPANGVLTAVDDFMAGRPDLELRRLPCIFGLGVLFSREAGWAADVEAVLDPLHEHPLLERLEENRLSLYTQVLRLQQQLGVERMNHDRAVDRLRRDVKVAQAEAATQRLAAFASSGSSPPG